MTTSEEIGGRLRTERERLGFNQEAFGAIGGVKRFAQGNYEKGDRQPDVSYLASIAKVGADVQYIVTGVRSSNTLNQELTRIISLAAQASPTELALIEKVINGIIGLRVGAGE